MRPELGAEWNARLVAGAYLAGLVVLAFLGWWWPFIMLVAAGVVLAIVYVRGV